MKRINITQFDLYGWKSDIDGCVDFRTLRNMFPRIMIGYTKFNLPVNLNNHPSDI